MQYDRNYTDRKALHKHFYKTVNDFSPALKDKKYTNDRRNQ